MRAVFIMIFSSFAEGLSFVRFRNPRSAFSQKLVVATMLIGASVVASSATEPKQPARHEFAETHMGSLVRLVLYTTEPDLAKKAASAAFARVAALDKTFSDYDNASELMRLVDRFASAEADPVPVSADLFAILRQAESISVVTHGAFDVTAAPVIRQWRRAFRERKMPTEKNLRDALGRVGHRRVTLIEQGRLVKLVPGTRIDLGGIAKGYAAAAALKALKEQGVPIALVAIAGDVAMGDAPPGEKGWRVDVAGLHPAKDKPLYRLNLRNAFVSTSGDAERFAEIDGKRYAHIVDPKTGLGVTRRATVTVVSQDGAASDAFATSLYLLGVQGDDLLGRLAGAPPLAVSWMEVMDDGRLELKTNPAFDRIAKP